MNHTQAIQQLLANKHSAGLYVPECKNGPTVGANHSRLDGWAMKRSWTDPMVDGYEIKVTHRDFMGDEKWHNYLSMCNRLWFVTPHGIVQPEEVPEGVGLLWASKNFKRLYKKKKATCRPDDVDIQTLRYVLIVRAQIRDENQSNGDDSEYWRKWLEKKVEDRRIGYRVSVAIREHVDNIEEENREMKRRVDAVEKVLLACERAGINTTRPYWENEMTRLIKEAKGIVLEPYQRKALGDAAAVITRMLKGER